MFKAGFFSGYKTYVVGITAIIAAIAAFSTDTPLPGSDVTLAFSDLAQLILTAILGMTIRHGVSNIYTD